MFKTIVKAKYAVLAVSRPPAPDYPPANVKEMVNICEAKGRADLGQKIMKQWVAVCDNYPNVRLNWGTVNIAGRSLKKNIFGGKEFAMWFVSQVEEVTPKEMEAAKAIPTVAVPQNVPAIAIPTDKETPEMWKDEANKTRELLVQVRAGFAEAAQFITFIEKEVSDLRQKIHAYGAGGPKNMIKKGELHAFAARVPKWEIQLKVLDEQLTAARKEIMTAEAGLVHDAHAYEHAPATTIAYEKAAQDSLNDILSYILGVKDLKKQQELLAKFKETLSRFDQKEVKASIEIQAGLGDAIITLWEKMGTMWMVILKWIKGLKQAATKFSHIANISY